MAKQNQNARTFEDKSQPNQKAFPGQKKPDDFGRGVSERKQEPMPNQTSSFERRVRDWEGKNSNKENNEFDHDDAEVDKGKEIPDQPAKF